MKRLPKVATKMALNVLAYNVTRVMNIMVLSRQWPDQGISKALGSGSDEKTRLERISAELNWDSPAGLDS